MRLIRPPFAALNGLVLAAILAATGAHAMAQTAPVAQPTGPSNTPMGHRDPAKMQALLSQHLADLKAKLRLTPTQEGAWSRFASSMQPPARRDNQLKPEQRAELDKMSTPERIDKMHAMRTQHMAEMSVAMDQRGEATKTFYAALTPEQQKVFDAQHKKHGPHGDHNGPIRHGTTDPVRP